MVASRICPVRSNYGPLFSLTESSGKAQTSTGPSPNLWSTMCSMLWTGSSDGRGLVYFKPHILSSAPYLLALLCISGTVTDLTWGSWVKSRITILDTQKMDLLGPLISPCQLFSIKWPQLANNHYMGTVCGTKICNVCNREPQNAWKRREESFSCRFLEYYFNLQPFLLLLGVVHRLPWPHSEAVLIQAWAAIPMWWPHCPQFPRSRDSWLLLYSRWLQELHLIPSSTKTKQKLCLIVLFNFLWGYPTRSDCIYFLHN